MPLPNPAYLADQSFNWDKSVFPAVLIATSAAITGTKRHIRWGALDNFDRRTVHDLIMGYNARLTTPQSEANAVLNFAAGSAYHTIHFGGGVVGGNSTGLVAGVDYTFSVVLNGTETFYTINGTNGLTFTALVAAMETALPATMLAEIFEGNIEVSSVATGSGQVIEVFDGDLFKNVTGFIGFAEIRVGVSVIADAFDLNFRDGYQSYTELLIGKLNIVPNKAPRSARSISAVYFNHGTGTWLLSYTDVAPVDPI